MFLKPVLGRLSEQLTSISLLYSIRIVASLTQWTWIGQTLGESEGRGRPACCSPRDRRASGSWVSEQQLCNKGPLLVAASHTRLQPHSFPGQARGHGLTGSSVQGLVGCHAVALFWVLDPLQAFLGVDMIQGLQLQGWGPCSFRWQAAWPSLSVCRPRASRGLSHCRRLAASSSRRPSFIFIVLRAQLDNDITPKKKAFPKENVIRVENSDIDAIT